MINRSSLVLVLSSPSLAAKLQKYYCTMGRWVLASCREHLEVLIPTVCFASGRTTVPVQPRTLCIPHPITRPSSLEHKPETVINHKQLEKLSLLFLCHATNLIIYTMSLSLPKLCISFPVSFSVQVARYTLDRHI